MKRLPRYLCAALAIKTVLIAYVPVCAQTIPTENVDGEFSDDSLSKLRDRLGGRMPTGLGVAVAQVEPYWLGGFMAFVGPGAGDFEDKVISNSSALPDGVSPHARTVGAIWYGDSHGVAPGITSIAAFEANDYLERIIQWNTGLINPGSLDLGSIRIVNNSWVYDGTAANAVRALRRADHQIDTQGVVYVNATHNSAYSNVPTLPASLYNGITVGRADGGSSRGPAFFDGRGRAKPDLVADTYATSYAVPVVSGAVALLIEQGAGLQHAGHPQLLKAIMLAGAAQPADWRAGEPTADDDAVHPLDWGYGAGLLRIDRNYEILASPRAIPGTFGGPRGWAYDSISESSAIPYYVQIATSDTTLSAALCWHRHHDGNFGGDDVLPLNFLTLELWRLEPDSSGPSQFVRISASPSDNVQFLHVTGLSNGRYALRVMRQTDFAPELENYGLAWWAAGEVLRGDMNGDNQINGFDLDPLLLAFFEPANYAAQFPGIDPRISGDTNYDGAFDFFDLDSFVTLLIGQ